MAAPWFGPILTPRLIPLRTTDCTGAIRSVLDGGASMTLTELRHATGNRWSSEEMGAALAKLQKRGEVESFEPANGKKKGRFYRSVRCNVY